MKKLIINFLKDKLFFSFIYFSNTIFMLLFFSLYTDKKISLTYPIILSVFIYVIFIIYKFNKYYMFNQSLAKSINNPQYELSYTNNEQNNVKKVIIKIHNNYINKINDLKEDSKDKNKLISQLVHDIKTPVSVIDLIVEKTGVDNTYKSNEFNEIKQENNKILAYLNNLLSMIRLDEFSNDYIPEVVNLDDSLKRVINRRKSQFIYNNVFPKIEFESKEIKVLTDQKWNEIMIGQIISNGIKYSSSLQENKNIYFNIIKKGSYTILSIEDEGIGIPKHDLERVFEPFYTGENGRKNNNSTGIGLYMTKLISEKLGHEINIESERHKGTKITIKYLSKM